MMPLWFGLVASLALTAVDDNAAAAREHVEAAQQLFEQGRYAEAIDRFEAAYRSKPHGALFFNIGKCAERLGDLSLARSSYREYLSQVPDANDRELVEKAIEGLERRLTESGAQLAPVLTKPMAMPSPVPVLTSRPFGPRQWSYVVGGLAAGALVAGGGLGFAAAQTRSELFARAHPSTEVQRLYDTALGQAIGANAGYGLALAAGLTAVILYFVGLADGSVAGASK